jgi:hypothetical protein
VVERQVAVKAVRRKLLELTTTGREYAADTLDLDVEQEGRGGIVHRFWQHWIKDVFEAAGWAAKIELFDADVYVNMNDTELVVEVAMGDNPREVEHVASHVDTFDVVWVACPNEDIIDALRERIAEQGTLDESVSFHPFQFFVEADHSYFA